MKKKLLILCLLCAMAPAGLLKASGPFVGSSIEVGGRLGIGAILPVGNAVSTGILSVDYTPGFSSGFDLHYTYMANAYFGFTTGVSYVALNSTMGASDVISTYRGDMELDLFSGSGSSVISEVHCIGTTTAVKEEYQTAFLEIPALLAIHNGHWYYDLGLRFAVPMKMNATYDYGESIMLIDEIYYTGITLNDPMPQPSDPGGSGDYDVLSNRSKSLYVLWSMEIGFNIDISNNASISLGAYFDYGLNEAKLGNKSSDELLSLNGSTVENYNGAINSNLMSGIRYYTIGARMLLNIGFGGHVGSGGRKSKSLL